MEDYLKAIIDLGRLHEFTTFRTIEPGVLLQPFVERYWTIAYHFPNGFFFDQTIIPNPHMSLVWYMKGSDTLVTEKVTIEGAVKRLFRYRLEGSGLIIGAKFHVGVPKAFLTEPLSHYVNKSVPVSDALGLSVDQLMTPSNQLDENINNFESALLGLNLEKDPKADFIAQLIKMLREKPSILTVDQLLNETNLSKRSLQRYFEVYVGVNPKWVIRMFRLQELKTKITNNEALDFVSLAYELGYSDQAHMINDFKNMVGVTPTELLQRNERNDITRFP